MGFLLKALGVGLAVTGVKKIKNNIEEERRRKNTVCRFDGEISKEEFYVISSVFTYRPSFRHSSHSGWAAA